ncbi:DUF1294 domain-containing protein [Chryseobacterium sp. RR2-3-20]|uniref:DUF1294 domain-containing protein n=1 Tax=Chryseobacterium sp. RR2-3-20 TaxID=2787626 RepID=UPI001FD783B4|nr:DUF1294 domain-containing protein [Chryseobacterium sp. RR2-3-20]
MIYFLIIINFLSFIVFCLDKRKAVKHQQRISEFTLLTITLAGGIIGSVLGMFIFNHKISKFSFLVKIGVIIIVQFVVVFLYINNQ